MATEGPHDPESTTCLDGPQPGTPLFPAGRYGGSYHFVLPKGHCPAWAGPSSGLRPTSVSSGSAPPACAEAPPFKPLTPFPGSFGASLLWHIPPSWTQTQFSPITTQPTPRPPWTPAHSALLLSPLAPVWRRLSLPPHHPTPKPIAARCPVLTCLCQGHRLLNPEASCLSQPLSTAFWRHVLGVVTSILS